MTDQERLARLETFAEFVSLWCWRDNTRPTEKNALSDAERLSAIKYHPVVTEQPYTKLIRGRD